MNYIKKYFILVCLLLLISNQYVSAMNENHEIKSFLAVKNVSELINEAKAQQGYISKYIKKYTKEQNVELFILWEKNLNSSLPYNHAIYYEINNKNNIQNKKYLNTLKGQFTKSGIYPSYGTKYNFYKPTYQLTLNYKEAYALFYKYIPEDWAKYLKTLASEQEDISETDLDRIALRLTNWENFINQYPNFERITDAYDKLSFYEEKLFLGQGVEKQVQGITYYTKDAIKVYDEFSNKYPNSKYVSVCTRFSNLKKNKHIFESPYKDQDITARKLSSEYTNMLMRKNNILRWADYALDINNNTWHVFSNDYIRGNYIYMSLGKSGEIKLYDKKYLPLSDATFTDNIKKNNLFLKNERLLYSDEKSFKIKELKYQNGILSLVQLDNAILFELFKDTNLIFISKLTKNTDNHYSTTIKTKKYLSDFIIYNDTNNNFSDYTITTNTDVEVILPNIITVNKKTHLELVSKQEDEASEKVISDKEEHKINSIKYTIDFE